MKVDAYRSKAKPAYGLIVPAGTDVTVFDGEVAEALNKLSPLEKVKTAVDLESISTGDLFQHLQSQIAEKGAGLMKIDVQFKEVVA